METVPTLLFAQTARVLVTAVRSAGLTVPAFRSPPRVAGVTRTIRRTPGGAVVAVQLRGRSLEAVVADMIDGVIATNALEGASADRLRAKLAQSVAQEEPSDRQAA